MYFDILKKVVNRKNKLYNVVFHQHISKWNKHTEIFPPIICYENQNITRKLSINYGHGVSSTLLEHSCVCYFITGDFEEH